LYYLSRCKYYYLQFLLELNKCKTWEEKLKVFNVYFKELNVLTIENQKLVCLTAYNHVIAIQDYEISSLPRLKTPITLLKPTFPIAFFTEEDYGLHKVDVISITSLHT